MADPIADMMLVALSSQTAAPPRIAVSPEEQRGYIKKNIGIITLGNRKIVGNLLVMNGQIELLRPCAEGIVVNIDNIPNHVIEQIYTYIKDTIATRE